MNKLYTATIFICSVLSGKAQPIINASFYPDFSGNGFDAKQYTNPAAINPGGNGVQTWNFGSLGAGSQTTAISFSGPSGSPYSAEFPGTNLVSKSTTSTSSAYFHYAKTTEKLELLGSVIGSNQSRTYLQNGEDQYYYSLGYNLKRTDSFYGATPTVLGTDTFSITIRRGTVSYTYDGYGTLTTPSGTSSNCIRISQRRVSKDSTYFLIAPITTILEQRSRAYLWLAAGPAVSPLKMTLSYDTIITANGTSPVISASYVLQPTSVQEDIQLDQTWSVSPNPTTDYLSLMSKDIKSQTFARIYTSHGKSEIVPFVGQNRVSVAHLPAGIYWIEIENKGKIQKTKFSKN